MVRSAVDLSDVLNQDRTSFCEAMGRRIGVAPSIPKRVVREVKNQKLSVTSAAARFLGRM
jgi:hypothetical protein